MSVIHVTVGYYVFRLLQFFKFQFRIRIYHRLENFEVILFRKLHGWPENDFISALETTRHLSGMEFSEVFSPQLLAGVVPCCVWHLMWRMRILG